MEIATATTQSPVILHECHGIEVSPDSRIISLESGKKIIVFGWFDYNFFFKSFATSFAVSALEFISLINLILISES
jgi:hypothetical protein